VVGLNSAIPEEFGGIAQLGERLHGMQEVNGSIPFISTIYLWIDGGARFKLIAE
jgi:hypothetical protein